MAFISSNYVLVIELEHFGIGISYSTKADLPYMYDCGNYFAEVYGEEERKGLIPGKDAESIIRNELIFAARGLENKWKNVLKGDTRWLEDYRKSSWYAKYSQSKIDTSFFD